MLPAPIANTKLARANALYHEIELQSKLETADPYTLVKTIYEELENSFFVLRAVSDRGIDVTGHREAKRAHSMLIALLSGLKRVEDSNLSELLANVYQSMAASVLSIVQHGNCDSLDELIDGTANLLSAWNKISK